jgi:peroxiredoxin-like protein
MYRTSIAWVGGRAGELRASGKSAFRVSSPPEFQGEAGTWSPEDLLVAAVNACTMTTFLALAKRSSLPVVAYESNATGLLESTDEGYRFTKVTVSPTITVESVNDVEWAEDLIEEAHRKCLVGNSLRARVDVVPLIEFKTEK